jgi:hypothetical protein
MQPGLHAIGWGLQRLVVVAGLAVFAALFAYSALVFIIIAVQAVSAFGS